MSFIELVAQRHPPKPPAGMQPPENAKDWFRIENSADDPDSTDIYVYESIGGWFGMWAEDFIYDLKQVATSKINLRLNSPGGSVFDGIAIANALRSHPATVTVYVDSLAASIASVIALAGDRVVMMPQSQFMVHNASGAAYGDATEMTKMADLLDKQSLNIAKAYAEHTGGSLAEWQDYMAAETWFSAEEAVAVGLADEVVPMKPAKGATPADAVAARMQQSWDLSMYRHAGREQAPAPTIASPAAAMAGITNSAPAPVEPVIEPEPVAEAEPVTEEPVESEPVTLTLQLSVGSADFTAQLAQLIEQLSALVPVQAADSPPEPEDASTPPPDEDEEEEEEDDDAPPWAASDNATVDPGVGDGAPQAEDGLAEEHPVEPVEAPDVADEWTAIVGSLVSTTSPGADDVFAQLKEGW